MSERQPPIEVPKPRELLEVLLTVPGSVGETYRRHYPYSMGNIALLEWQGCPREPIGTYAFWKKMGHQVLKNMRAYSILRPINIKVSSEDEEEERMIQRFKPVRAIFALSQTSGPELPPYVPPEWSEERAMEELGITQVPFESYNGNIGGYSVGNQIAINPIAPNRHRTFLHEASHVLQGHTALEDIAKYQEHRGLYEFEAEATAYLCMKEIGSLDEQTASVSRDYVQSWLRDQRPPKESIRRVLTGSTRLIDAGYLKQNVNIDAEN